MSVNRVFINALVGQDVYKASPLAAIQLKNEQMSPETWRLFWGRLREGAESYAKALASDILR